MVTFLHKNTELVANVLRKNTKKGGEGGRH